MLALSTSALGRRAASASAGRDLIAAAADSGYDALFIDRGSGVLAPDLPEVMRTAAAAGLSIAGLCTPLPDAPLAPGKRLPWLAAADDREERAAAVALTVALLSSARDLGARQVLLDLGSAGLRNKVAAFRRGFARGEMDEGEPGYKRLHDALAERKARAEPLLDACRDSLERVARAAERLSVTLLLSYGALPWSVPSPREALVLLRHVGGAPVGLLDDPAAWEVLTRLGLQGPPGRREDLLAVATVARVNDAVGIETGWLPGLGDGPFGAHARPAPKQFPWVLVGGRSPTIAHAHELGPAAAVVKTAGWTAS